MLLLLAAAAAAQIANDTEGNLSLSSNLSVNASVFSPPDQLDVGVNLSPLTTDGYGVTEWAITSTRVFRDLFKHATPWARERAAFVNGERTETWKSFGLGQGALAVNLTFANGYPSSLPRWGSYGTEQRQSVVAYVGRGGAHVAGGQYAVHFDGNGTLGFAGDASEAGFSYSPEARRGRYLVDVSPAGGVELRVLSTDAADPLHNIRMVRVSDEVRDATGAVDVNATDAALRARPFHEDLLETLRGVRILRFCGWALIDNNDWHDNNFLPAWEGRTTPDSLTQAGPRGVALECAAAQGGEA